MSAVQVVPELGARRAEEEPPPPTVEEQAVLGEQRIVEDVPVQEVVDEEIGGATPVGSMPVAPAAVLPAAPTTPTKERPPLEDWASKPVIIPPVDEEPRPESAATDPAIVEAEAADIVSSSAASLAVATAVDNLHPHQSASDIASSDEHPETVTKFGSSAAGLWTAHAETGPGEHAHDAADRQHAEEQEEESELIVGAVIEGIERKKSQQRWKLEKFGEGADFGADEDDHAKVEDELFENLAAISSFRKQGPSVEGPEKTNLAEDPEARWRVERFGDGGDDDGAVVESDHEDTAAFILGGIERKQSFRQEERQRAAAEEEIYEAAYEEPYEEEFYEDEEFLPDEESSPVADYGDYVYEEEPPEGGDDESPVQTGWEDYADYAYAAEEGSQPVSKAASHWASERGELGAAQQGIREVMFADAQALEVVAMEAAVTVTADEEVGHRRTGPPKKLQPVKPPPQKGSKVGAPYRAMPFKVGEFERVFQQMGRGKNCFGKACSDVTVVSSSKASRTIEGNRQQNLSTPRSRRPCTAFVLVATFLNRISERASS